MSASPARAKKLRSPYRGLSLSSDPNRVIEPDLSSLVPSPTVEGPPPPALAPAPAPAPDQAQTNTSRWFAPLLNTVLFVIIVSALVAGAFLVELFLSLWQQVRAHGQQLSEQQVVLQRFRGSQHSAAEMSSHLKSLDTNSSTLFALLEAQSKRLDALENGQAGLARQLQGTNARWQRQWHEFRRSQSSSAGTPSGPTAAGETPPDAATNSTPAPALPPTPVSTEAEKDHDTFRPELKPHPQAQAHLADNGMVVWLTPRPGFSKLVPTSVIHYITGLGFLVHDWDDNQHYFITEAGTWMADQR